MLAAARPAECRVAVVERAKAEQFGDRNPVTGDRDRAGGPAGPSSCAERSGRAAAVDDINTMPFTTLLSAQIAEW